MAIHGTPISIGRSEADGGLQPGAPAHGLDRSSFRTLWIADGRRRIVIGVVPILDPLRGVSRQVPRAIRADARGKAANREG